MDACDHMRLQKNWTHLLDSVNTDDILPYLVQELVFDIDMMEEVLTGETRKKKTRLLLTKLMRRGPEAYEAFRRALLQNSVYEHLIQRLDNTQVDSSKCSVHREDIPDIGISELEDDRESISPLSENRGLQNLESVQPEREPIQQSSEQETLSSNASTNCRVVGSNNFLIIGSSNTQVFYH